MNAVASPPVHCFHQGETLHDGSLMVVRSDLAPRPPAQLFLLALLAAAEASIARALCNRIAVLLTTPDPAEAFQGFCCGRLGVGAGPSARTETVVGPCA